MTSTTKEHGYTTGNPNVSFLVGQRVQTDSSTLPHGSAIVIALPGSSGVYSRCACRNVPIELLYDTK
jgi:hypothetical protein